MVEPTQQTRWGLTTPNHEPWNGSRPILVSHGLWLRLGFGGLDLRGTIARRGWTYGEWTPSVADRSASLVRIDDQLSDSPFGVVHHHLTPTFSLVVLWVIGWHGTASWNFSVMHRLLPFSADLILFFRDQYTGIKGEVSPFGDLPSGHSDPEAFISSFFLAFSFLFAT
uniref:Uncharacterized protein n=1 Tax=Solanum tuberosum TaxID=4113 RepID=M1DDK7_SOLTU